MRNAIELGYKSIADELKLFWIFWKLPCLNYNLRNDKWLSSIDLNTIQKLSVNFGSPFTLHHNILYVYVMICCWFKLANLNIFIFSFFVFAFERTATNEKLLLLTGDRRHTFNFRYLCGSCGISLNLKKVQISVPGFTWYLFNLPVNENMYNSWKLLHKI